MLDYAEFVVERQAGLLRFAMVLTSDPGVSEDIVADMLDRAFEQWDRIGSMDHPNAYLRRMVVNEYLALRRRWWRARPQADLSEHDSLVPDPSEDYAERDAVLARLGTLPPKQRAVLVLRFYQGLNDTEIAETLRCTTSTVRSQLSRALARLRIDPGATSVSLPAPGRTLTSKEEI